MDWLKIEGIEAAKTSPITLQYWLFYIFMTKEQRNFEDKSLRVVSELCWKGKAIQTQKLLLRTQKINTQ